MTTFEIHRPVKAAPPPLAKDGYASFLRVEPELAALADSEVVRVNLPIPRACALVVASVPRIMQLRPLVVDQLPRHPLETIDKLEDYALALVYANAPIARRRSDGSIQKLHAEVVALRASLLVAADALAHAKLLDRGTIAKIREGSGYVDMAQDLSALSVLFRTNWRAVKDKTAVLQEDVERADALGRELLKRQGSRMQPIKPRTARDEQVDVRNRCFTLLMRAYAECRAVAAYLRRHERDAEQFAPNLFAKAPTKRRKKDDAVADQQVGPDAATRRPERTSKRRARTQRRRMR